MEDVLDLYCAPEEPGVVRVTMDESSLQLLEDVYEPLAMAPGRPRRQDDQYQRNGVRALFMFFDPFTGWRRVSSREHRTKVDWALEIQRLLDQDYPDARKVQLICDNLNTHHVASLYEAFEPAEARRLAERLEIHYTPKHGSWLNVAEIELSALSRQCLSRRRIADAAMLDRELLAWSQQRNEKHLGVAWRFTTADARIKLHYLYPPV
jgi:hypothetical protein